jgi:hypothetical protein
VEQLLQLVQQRLGSRQAPQGEAPQQQQEEEGGE